MKLIPVTFSEAKEFVFLHHRHHMPPVGHKYSIGCESDGVTVGVVMVGRPVSRHLDNGLTLEVTRLCTIGHRNACSFLYSAAWRVCRNLGYTRLITYILKSESGTSLEASGWKAIYETKGGSWSSKKRPRVDKHPVEPKILFEAQ